MNKRNILPVAIFIFLAVIQGSLFITRVGPLTIPDPNMHSPATYAVATNQMFNPVSVGTDSFGNTVRNQPLTGDSRYVYRSGLSNVSVIDATAKVIHGDAMMSAQRSINSQRAQIVTIPDGQRMNRANQYFPLNYIPQAIGLRLALSLDVKPFTGWQMARASNLIAYILLFSVAIAILPRGRYLMLLIGIFPSAVFMASSLMIDGIIIALSAVFAAVLAKLVKSGVKASYWTLGLLTVLTIALMYEKFVYALLGLVVLVLPHEVLSVKRKLIFVSICLTFLMLYAWWYLSYSTSLSVVPVAQNVAYIQQRPIKFVIMVLLSTLKLVFIIGHLPLWCTVSTGLIVLVWIVLMTQNRNLGITGLASWISTYRYALVAFVACFIAMAITVVFLALTWNLIPHMRVTDAFVGFQMRYAAPFAPALILALSSRTSKQNTSWQKRQMVV